MLCFEHEIRRNEHGCRKNKTVGYTERNVQIECDSDNVKRIKGVLKNCEYDTRFHTIA
jgi:hypothetical protein